VWVVQINATKLTTKKFQDRGSWHQEDIYFEGTRDPQRTHLKCQAQENHVGIIFVRLCLHLPQSRASKGKQKQKAKISLSESENEASDEQPLKDEKR
jgi:hypothetical protein